MKDDNKKRRRDNIAVLIISLLIFAAAAAIVACIVKNTPESAAPVIRTAVIFFSTVLLITVLCGVNFQRHAASREKQSLEHLMYQLNSMVILWDVSFEYIKVNDTFIRATGYSEENLKDPEVLARILPADAFSQNLQSIINNRDEEFFIKTKNGSTICTIWSTSVVASLNTRTGPVTIMMSIGPDLSETQRMKQEIISYSNKLQEAERRYALSMDLSEIGLLLKEKGSTLFYASEQLIEMFGLESHSGYISGDSLREAFHPKDRAIFDKFASMVKSASKGIGGDEIHSVDFRAMSADGTYHWYNFRYRAVTDNDNFSVGGAVMDITTDKEKDLMIERMAYVDETTQIYNRNKFMLIGNEILDASRSGRDSNYWVIVIDIDSFHIINDTCGYANGNFVLKEIAAIITSNLTEGGFTARIGGDNFAILIRADDDNELPVRLIKRIQLDIANIGGMGIETQNITCSAGYCMLTDGGMGDFAQVLDRAEFALSLSDGSKSSILRFDNHAHDAIIAGNEVERELIRAVENQELVLYYQPKINLENGKIMGMEALIRWIKPDGTVVPPGEFIPVAENSLLITKISKFVLKEACRQNKEWQDKGLDPITVSINLTAIDFYQTNVTESIREALSSTGLDPQWLDVELTESLALKDIDHAVSQMKEIKELGVKLSMDDFGTGYSSLSYIQILPISVLKLDRSFIMYLEDDEISREIVSAVIRIARSKKIETIAEGIETVAQAEILKQSGCDHAQGYFFGKPMPAEQFEIFLRARKVIKV